ncbi:MAG: type II secretion system protein M [Nitrospirae bacterium]|nr:type II secretion system protein M [Nitrospirota bacterium]MBI3594538.1 type II secretion system protein M [Nitrospirota bacterium]
MGRLTLFQEGWSRLGRRERRILAGGAVFLILLVSWLLIFSPILERMSWYDRQALQKEKDLIEFSPLKESYLKIRNHLDQIEHRIGPAKNEFSFPAYLENLAVQIRVKNRMTTLRPRATQSFDNLKSTEMEVKLEDLTLSQAVDFISKIEHSPEFLYIRNLHMRTRYGEPKNLDLTMTVSHYEKSQ